MNAFGDLLTHLIGIAIAIALAIAILLKDIEIGRIIRELIKSLM